MIDKKRCQWVTDDSLYIAYHDNEWGQPNYDSRYLFAMLCLEGMQAGLSWLTVLKKRQHYYEVFDDFDPIKIATYDSHKLKRLINDQGIIRHHLKIEAIIKNAKAWNRLALTQDVSEFMWQFVNGIPIINYWTESDSIPTQTETSLNMSKILKKNGFSFVGPTICYAYMQAVGMVNDHLTTCFCHPKF